MKFVIGDLHGEIRKLKSLIQFILATAKCPEFIFLGDYVDKGEDSRETLKYLLELKQQYTCHFLIGNHDYFWLRYLEDREKHDQFLQTHGGVTTQRDFNAKTISAAHEQIMLEFETFFHELKLYWKNEKYFVVHSGISVDAFEKQPENLVASDVLFNRYTFFKEKRLYNGLKIIFGHTAFYDVFYDGFKIGIDTGACYSNTRPLTAFCIDSSELFSSERKIRSLSSVNTEFSPCIIYRKKKNQ
jgi:serine/threonine protein phosphatase 1